MALIDHEKAGSKKRGHVERKPKVKVVAPLGKSGLVTDLRKRLQLKQTDFARLLSVSVRSLATLEGGKPPTEAVSRKLMELQRLTNALSEVIEQNSLGTWLKTPNDAFDGSRPLDVIDRGESDSIWSMIYFLRSGVPS